RIHHIGGEPGKGNAAQQAAPDVAVSNNADQLIGGVQHESDLNAAAFDRSDRLAHSRLRPNNGFAPGSHGYFRLVLAIYQRRSMDESAISRLQRAASIPKLPARPDSVIH